VKYAAKCEEVDSRGYNLNQGCHGYAEGLSVPQLGHGQATRARGTHALKQLPIPAIAVWLLAALFITCLSFAGAIAETGKFEGKGEAPLKGYDIRSSRKLAVKRAVRSALEEAAGSILNPEVFRKKYELLDKQVFSKPKRFVRNTTPLSEVRKGSRYVVVVWVDVDMSALRSQLVKLGLLPPPESLPRWMIFIPARMNNGSRNSAWKGAQAAPSIPESEFEKIIAHYGYRIVRPGGDESLTPKMIEKPVESLAKVLTEAKRMGATHLLIGESGAYSGKGISKREYTLGTAWVNIQAVEVATGKVVGEANARASLEFPDNVDLDEKVIPAACRKLRDDVIGWMAIVNPVGGAGFKKVSLILKGFVTYAEYKAVIVALEDEIPGVRKVSLRSLARGEAEIEARFASEGSELARLLVKHRFKGFSLELEGEAGGKFILKLVPRLE